MLGKQICHALHVLVQLHHDIMIIGNQQCRPLTMSLRTRGGQKTELVLCPVNYNKGDVSMACVCLTVVSGQWSVKQSTIYKWTWLTKPANHLATGTTGERREGGGGVSSRGRLEG